MKNRSFTLFLLALLLATVWSACEDVVSIDLEDAESSLVVDAWLDNRSQPQVIRLTRSQAYFDNSLALGVEEASVSVVTGGSVLEFESSGDGNYTWLPTAGRPVIGAIGDTFSLVIEWNSETYLSQTVLFPSPEIDTIEQYISDGDATRDDGLYGEFIARDLTGRGNCYWIKSFKNGTFLNKPEEINIAYDAGFDSGGDTDGLIFITPIREAINPVADPVEDGEDPPSPFEVGDSLRVEIHSISEDVFRFMEIMRDQLVNGSNGIFSFPLANAPSNVFCESCENEALGVFNVAEISSSDYIFD